MGFCAGKPRPPTDCQFNSDACGAIGSGGSDFPSDEAAIATGAPLGTLGVAGISGIAGGVNPIGVRATTRGSGGPEMNLGFGSAGIRVGIGTTNGTSPETFPA